MFAEFADHVGPSGWAAAPHIAADCSSDAVTRFLCQCHESWLSVLKYLCSAWSAKTLS